MAACKAAGDIKINITQEAITPSDRPVAQNNDNSDGITKDSNITQEPTTPSGLPSAQNNDIPAGITKDSSSTQEPTTPSNRTAAQKSDTSAEITQTIIRQNHKLEILILIERNLVMLDAISYLNTTLPEGRKWPNSN